MRHGGVPCNRQKGRTGCVPSLDGGRQHGAMTDGKPGEAGRGFTVLLRPIVFAINFRPVTAENEVVVDFAEAGWGLALGVAE